MLKYLKLECPICDLLPDYAAKNIYIIIKRKYSKMLTITKSWRGVFVHYTNLQFFCKCEISKI